MYTLLGLLERPSSESFSMIPIIVRETGDAIPEVCGLSESSSWRNFKSTEEAKQILQTQGLNLKSLMMTFPNKPEGMIAVWTGATFLLKCRTFQTPPPIAPVSTTEQRTVAGDLLGRIWITSTEDAYTFTHDWLKKTAILACKKKSISISRLMIWCLPTHELTQAVDWYTAFGNNSRQRYLQWHLTYPLNQGMDITALETRHRTLVENLFEKS